MDRLRDVHGPDGLEELDRRLAVLCREQGPLRAVVARLAWWLVHVRACERLGYARASDYAVERLGISGRSLQSLARVGRAFLRWPALEQALVEGRLGWTKVRLLAGLPNEEDMGRWIGRAERVTADRLAKRVRAVDRYAVDEGTLAQPSRGGRLLELRCTPEVRRKWGGARLVASRAAGRRLDVGEAAEQIAAEVLSALPVDAPDEADEGVDAAESMGHPGPERWARRWAVAPAGRTGPLEPELRRLLDGFEEADAFEVDGRLRRALAWEQSLEARIAPLLVLAWQPGVHRALGFATRESWVRERLGMDPTRARALVRLERACAESPALARAWRNGTLSWVKAMALEPLVGEDPLGRFVAGWVRWAGRVTVRRLRDDVEQARTMAETDREAFRVHGGLPAEAQAAIGRSATGSDREIGANHTDPGGDIGRAEPSRSGVGDGLQATERENRGGDGPPADGGRGARSDARPRLRAAPLVPLRRRPHRGAGGAEASGRPVAGPRELRHLYWSAYP